MCIWDRKRDFWGPDGSFLIQFFFFLGLGYRTLSAINHACRVYEAASELLHTHIHIDNPLITYISRHRYHIIYAAYAYKYLKYKLMLRNN